MDHAEILAAIEAIVSPAYLVGGCVRDMLLNKPSLDYDVATPLTPDEIEAAVRAAGKRPYLVGKKFGTVGLKIEGYQVEVTTFRKETYQAGSRKPEVAFVTDLTRDLGRRDFTVNAMAYRNGKVRDPFGGKKDIVSKTIRAVGNPGERFGEDPLRMLRAARFAAQLGFRIEENTETAILHHAHKILEVSRERWVQELDKLLESERPSLGLEVLATTRLLNFMLPEIAIQVGYDQNSPYHSHSLWEHTKKVVDGLPRDLGLRWAALFHDAGKPFVRTDKQDRSNYVLHELVSRELVIRAAKYLNWSHERAEAVAILVGEHMRLESPLHEADSAAK